MNRFLEKFAKRDEKQREDARLQKYVGSGSLGGIGLGALGFAGAALPKDNLSNDDFFKYVDDVKNLTGVPTSASPLEGNRFETTKGSHYASNIFGGDHIKSRKRLGTLAHEFGHAQSLGKHIRNPEVFGSKMIKGLEQGARKYGVPLGIGLGATAARSDNDTLNTVAPYVPALMFSPTLLEEAKASGIGLNNIRKLRGNTAMLKEILPLTAAFGSYAAAPLAMGYALKKYIDSKKNHQEKKAEENSKTKQALKGTAIGAGIGLGAGAIINRKNLKINLDDLRASRDYISKNKSGLAETLNSSSEMSPPKEALIRHYKEQIGQGKRYTSKSLKNMFKTLRRPTIAGAALGGLGVLAYNKYKDKPIDLKSIKVAAALRMNGVKGLSLSAMKPKQIPGKITVKSDQLLPLPKRDP